MNSSTGGKICGAIGLLMLVGSMYTYFFVTGSGVMAGAQALTGVALIGVFFATNYSQLGQFASRKSSFFVASTAVTGVVVLAALGALNYVVAKKGWTHDYTSKKIFTLAPQTVSTLKGLKEPVKAIGFISSSHPSYDQLESLFQRYRREAPDKFDFVFKDPKKSPDLAAKYELKEGQTTVILTRGTGEKESHTALNIVSEQELTNALIKINAVGEQRVYFVQGHGEWGFDAVAHGEQDEAGGSLSELKTTLGQEGYAPEVINLAGKTELPKDAAVVVIAGTKSKFAEPEIKVLQAYLDQGGRLLFFAEAQQDAGLDGLLKGFGIEVDKGVIADDHFAVNSPYVVLSQFYGEHEITRLLKSMQMTVEFPPSRGFTVIHEGLPEGVTPTPVVLTSPYAWEETKPNDEPQRSDGEKSGQIPLVVASTHNTGQAKDKRYDEARLVVFGNSEMLLDGNWGLEPNRNLVMNAIAWGTQQVNKITLRPPDRDTSTIDLDNGMIAKIRFVSTDLFPMMLLSVGLAIWISRRNT